MKTLYALLVGIDHYRAAPDLAGCARDVREVAGHLHATVAPGTRLALRKLCDGEATRDAVIDAFRSHLGQAGPDDAVLFWFSGHGSDAEAPDWALPFEPTARVQTLVCADSRSDDIPDLWDKELAVLLDEVCDRAGHVAVVLDSCHSDGASRILEDEEPATRSRAVREAETRDPATFLPGTIERTAAAPPMRHVQLAACHSFETAEEMILDGERRGVFSWALLRSRRRLGPAATYRDLLRAAQAELAGRARQSPQLQPYDSGLLDQPFLGGAVAAPDSAIWMRWTADGWAIDAGAVHGLTADDDADVRVGVRDTVAQGGEARIIGVRSESSLVDPVHPWQPSRDEQFPVVMTSVPLPRTTVALTWPSSPGGSGGDGTLGAGTAFPPSDRISPAAGGMSAAPGGAFAAPGAFAGPGGAFAADGAFAGPGGAFAAAVGASAHLRLLRPDSPEVPDLRVTVNGDGRTQVRDHTGSLLDERKHFGAYAVLDALAVLEHIARWRLIWNLENPASALGSPVAVEILDRWGAPLHQDDRDGYVARYVRGRQGWQPPTMRIRLHNTGQVPLFCVLLDLTPRFRVHPHLFPGKLLAPGAYGECMEGRLIKASLPAGVPIEPGTSASDRLKLFVAEQQFAAEPFELPELGRPIPQSRILSTAGLMERLGHRTGLRDLDAFIPTSYDWTTAKQLLTTQVP